MNQKNENQNSNTPYIPRILQDSGLNITFHSIDPNTNIQSEKSVLPNGTYEKHFKDLGVDRTNLYPVNWYQSKNYKKKIEIIGEAIRTNTLIENTPMFIATIEGVR